MKMNFRKKTLSIFLITVCIICNYATELPDQLSIKDTTCDCPNTELISEGGFADMYSRYLGVWVNVGDYHDQPMYRCLQGCSGLTDKLVFLREEGDPTMGHWAIVDCTPEDAVFCGNAVHETIRRPLVAVGTTCPYSDINTKWEYCIGEHVPSGCTEYATDATLHFTSCEKTN